MKQVLMTGGGTAGHVTPNIAIMPYLKEMGFEISYMGSYNGIERTLIEGMNIPYTGIDSGKLRRYASLQNLKDPYHVLRGVREAENYIKDHRPDVVFSKGGFVAVPVVLAARKYKIPIVIHESDLSLGLANKLCIPEADVICYSFPETAAQIRTRKRTVYTGLPVRDDLKKGDPQKALDLCGFSNDKPLLMVIGGSTGSVRINEAVRDALPKLLEAFQVLHLCGKGKTDPFVNFPGYVQFEYLNEELKDVYAAAQVVLSRAGSNVIHEIATLKKPSILIPLDLNASRGDQIQNAESFRKRGFCEILREAALNSETLCETVNKVYADRGSYINAMGSSPQEESTKIIANIIADVS